MFVSDDQLYPAQAAIGQSAQEFVPEHLGFAGLDGDAQNLAPPVGVDRNRHYGCHADDPSRTPHLDVGGVFRGIRPVIPTTSGHLNRGIRDVVARTQVVLVIGCSTSDLDT